MHTTKAKPRRSKPVNQDKRKTLRYDRAVEDAVARLQRAAARNGTQLDFSKAVRTLIVDGFSAARALSVDPSAWPQSQTVDLPAELWEAITECRNRLSHSQGSLYTIMRKLNFDESVDAAEVREAFTAVQESRGAVERIEARMVAFLTQESDEAGAKSDGPQD